MKKIDIKAFAKTLQCLLDAAKVPAGVSDDPQQAFEGYFGGPGLTEHPVCWEPAVTVFAEHMPDRRFEVRTGHWVESEAPTSDQRVIRITEDGILGELEQDDDSTITEWFPIETPAEVCNYVQLLDGKPFSKQKRADWTEQSVESLVEDVYVPFFRHPDDLDLQQRWCVWASVKPLHDLIIEHIREPRQWMQAPRSDRYRIRDKEELEAKMKREGRTKLTPGEEFFSNVPIEQVQRIEDIKRRCIEAARALTDRQVLTPEDESRVVDLNWPYMPDPFTGGYVLPLKVKLNRFQFGPYFRQETSPDAYNAVTDLVLARFRAKEVLPKHPGKVKVPPLLEQKRLTFESARYNHELTRLGRRLSSFAAGETTPPDTVTQLKRKQFRYLSFSKMLDRLPSETVEISRAVHPLPFFFEAPLLRWERSVEKLAYHSAVACLQQLLKLSCLLGLEELHVRRNGIEQFQQMPQDVMAGIQGKPALGHWNDCLKYLQTMSAQLPVWGPWLDLLRSERGTINMLVDARNRIAHPEYIVELESLATVESQFADFFGDIFPKLRILAESMEVMLSNTRKARRDSDYGLTFELECLDLKSAIEPFPALSIILPEATARGIIDGAIFCRRGDHVMSLSNFFLVREIKVDTREIFVYDKDFQSGKAKVIGLTTGLSQNMTLPQGVFIFH